MEAKEFFNKAKSICNKYYGHCTECVLTCYCSDGIFAANDKEADEVMYIVETTTI